LVLPISQPESNRHVEQGLTWHDWRPTLVAAVVSAGAVALLILAFDSVSPFERPAVLESLTGTVYWIASASIGACGTIAALMLTTLSLTERLETRRMGPRFLFHMRLTVLAAIATIGFAVAALVLTTFPLAGGADVHPPRWQIDAVYFALQALTALMVGGFAVVLSSLYSTIADVFGSLPQGLVEEILTDGEQNEPAVEAVDRAEGAADQAEDAAERAEESAAKVDGAGHGHRRPRRIAS
jgi:hypothetical protein